MSEKDKYTIEQLIKDFDWLSKSGKYQIEGNFDLAVALKVMCEEIKFLKGWYEYETREL